MLTLLEKEPLLSQGIEKIVGQIWQNAESDPSLHLYAILDAARDTRIHSRFVENRVSALSLFRGDKALELATVAPYLVALQRDADLTEWFFQYGWGNSWGIIIEASVGLSDLKRHFQNFIMVYDDTGKPVYFRFYDPRVFRVYLPTCNAAELETIFGPVNAYYVEDEEPNVLIHYSLADHQLVERKIRR